MRRIVFFKYALPVAAGLLAGTLSSVYVGSRQDAQSVSPQSPPAAATENGHEAAPARWHHAAHRVRALENRVADLAGDEAAVAKRRAETTERGLQERARQKQRAAEQMEALAADIEDHGRAPVDVEWADSTTASINSTLEDAIAIHDSDVDLDTVDCRTDTCLATLKFPSYPQALDAYAQYFMAPYEVSCMRTSFLPPPEDDSQAYQASFLFHDCQK